MHSFVDFDRPFHVAFIGGGINSAVGRAHFCALNLDQNFRLVSGCFSRDPRINRESALFYNVSDKRIYSDYEQLIENERDKIDAAIVLTPTVDHYNVVIALLESGIPVICEKSLATSVEEVEYIKKIELKTNGFLVVTYNYTGYPALRELRSLIRSGYLGKINSFVAEMPQEGFARHDTHGRPIKPQSWRLFDGDIPTVSLDLGIHLHQIIHYLIEKKPIQAFACQKSYGNFENVVDYVSAFVDYENEIHGIFYYGKSLLGYKNGLRIRVFGSKASAEWEQINPEFLKINCADGSSQIIDRSFNNANVFNETRYSRFKAGHPAGYIEAFANIYYDIKQALASYKSQNNWISSEIFGTDLSLEGLKLLHAFAMSSNKKKVVCVT